MASTSVAHQQRPPRPEPTARGGGRESAPLAHRAPAIEQQWRASASEELAAPLVAAVLGNMSVVRCAESTSEEEEAIWNDNKKLEEEEKRQNLKFAPAPTELVTCSGPGRTGARCRRPCARSLRRRQPLMIDRTEGGEGNECDCREEEEWPSLTTTLTTLDTTTTTATTTTTNYSIDSDLGLGIEKLEEKLGSGTKMQALEDDDAARAIAAHQHHKHHRHRRAQPWPRWPRHWQVLAQLALIYILLTVTSSSNQPGGALEAQATNYWPLRSMGRHRRPPDGLSPDSQSPQLQPLQPMRSQSQVEDELLKVKSGQLMIGQHYTNFSSIIPYSIVQDADYGLGSSGGEPEDQLLEEQQANGHQYPQQHQEAPGGAQSRALLSPLSLAAAASSAAASVASTSAGADSNRLILPQMQQIKSRFNQGCVGGTKCQFFAFCWMSGGSLGASCGLLMTCCVTPSRQEIQPGFYGPVVNDPYCGRSTSKINRIVGGTDASFGQFPWQAFVQVGGSRCGGALISSRHVVTAGHCVARSQHSPASIKVTLGDYILNSDIESIPHEVFSVVEVLLHPNFRFTPQADRYDVAVLELDRQANYKDNIKPICLPQKDAAFVGRMAYVAGWGALQAGSKLRPKVLQHVAVPVIENHVCEGWHRRKGIDIRIYDEMMCAGYELGQRDACQGDSGGPLMLNQFGVWYLVGIVSAGYSCAKQYQPGIYHRVSSSSDWISSNIYQQGANK